MLLPVFLLLVTLSTMIPNPVTSRRRFLQSCPPIYMRYSYRHTACKPPNPQCTIYFRGVTKEDQAFIVRKHNFLRSMVALGYERTNNQPSAANMMQMVWDDELAAVAQKHADQCIFAHDCAECRSVEAFSVGQNIATRARTGDMMPVPDWDYTIQSLYNEVKDFNPKWIKPFRAPKYPMTGHYTQALWATTWKVGCGYTVHSYSKDPRFHFVELYTCNYGPTGNLQMGEMYRIGQPCSQCPENTCCGKQCEYLGVRAEYDGLCKVMNGYGPQPTFPRGNIFLWCNFRAGHPNTDWCAFSVDGARQWKTRKVASGTYATIVLNGGQKTTLDFVREMDLPRAMCVEIEYRKGPHMAGDRSSNYLSGTLHSVMSNGFYYLNFTSDANDWTTTALPVNWWGGPSMLTLTFSASRGAPPQYLDLREITVREGRCMNY